MRKLELDNRRSGHLHQECDSGERTARTFEDDWSLTVRPARPEDENAAEAVAYRRPCDRACREHVGDGPSGSSSFSRFDVPRIVLAAQDKAGDARFRGRRRSQGELVFDGASPQDRSAASLIPGNMITAWSPAGLAITCRVDARSSDPAVPPRLAARPSSCREPGAIGAPGAQTLWQDAMRVNYGLDLPLQ